MSESAPIIRARDLRKVYRLYASPRDRFLDMVGLGRLLGTQYSEHAALDGVTLDIRRGEKVAIIGRNGAGKSTFLKLVSGVTEPTSGTLQVSGTARALLQIGTGFHPEFTGRDNVRAYLAQLGIDGAEARDLTASIIEFAEIEEYIDQPLKTYSTGMAARLMFAASTAVSPDLLIIDEILGVGDAYFSRKSFERIELLARSFDTTLLLVTHDVYSAAKLCDRMIWIDRGRVIFDAEPLVTLKAYEDSVRTQEEARLRKKTLDQLERRATRGEEMLLLEFAALNNLPQPGPVWFRRVELFEGDISLGHLPLKGREASERAGLVRNETCWGDEGVWCGSVARPLQNYGSSFHKVAGFIHVADLQQRLEQGVLRVEVEYGAEQPSMIAARLFAGEREVLFEQLPFDHHGWLRRNLSVDPAASASSSALINRSGHYGNGGISIEAVDLADGQGRSTRSLRHGARAVLSFDYRLMDPAISECADIIVAVLREGVETSCRFFTRDLRFDATTAGRGRVELKIERLGLGAGKYSLTLLIARQGYVDRSDHKFFSINPDVFVCIRDLLEFEVTARTIVAQGTPYVAQGQWSFRNVSAERSEGRPSPASEKA